jgi:pimeloyl-ACP methyl ester carboxylesterase
MKSLILFVHGLGGSADGTWIKFPQLIEQDPELAARYDVRTFGYSTAMFGATPPFQTCADALKTEIETRYSAYSSIAIVAHSQGGLIARWHIADQINSQRPLRIDRLLTFATPHQGAGGASVLRWIPGASRQTKALDPNSEFRQALGLAWGQSKADQKIATRDVVAEDDWVVGSVSATGSSPIDVAVVGGVGHIGVVKPASAAASSFLVAKSFLLDDSWRPSGVEADYRPPVLRFNQLQLVHGVSRMVQAAA